MSSVRVELKKLYNNKVYEFTSKVIKQSMDGYNKTYLMQDVKLNGLIVASHCWCEGRNSRLRKILEQKIKEKEEVRFVGKIYSYKYEKSGKTNYTIRILNII